MKKENAAWEDAAIEKHKIDKELLNKVDSWFLFTNITKKYRGKELHKIIYTKDIFDIKTKGTFGGWVEKESNLSKKHPFFMDENTIIMGQETVVIPECFMTIEDSVIYNSQIRYIEKTEKQAIAIEKSKISYVDINDVQKAYIYIGGTTIEGAEHACVFIKTTNGRMNIADTKIVATKDICIDCTCGQIVLREDDIKNVEFYSSGNNLDISSTKIGCESDDGIFRIEQNGQIFIVQESNIISKNNFLIKTTNAEFLIEKSDIRYSGEDMARNPKYGEWDIHESSFHVEEAVITGKVNIKQEASTLRIVKATIDVCSNDTTRLLATDKSLISIEHCNILKDNICIYALNGAYVTMFFAETNGKPKITASNNMVSIKHSKIFGEPRIESSNNECVINKSCIEEKANISNANIQTSTIKGTAKIFNVGLTDSAISGDSKIGFIYGIGETNVLQKENFPNVISIRRSDFIIVPNEFFKDEYAIVCKEHNNANPGALPETVIYYMQINKIKIQRVSNISQNISNYINKIFVDSNEQNTDIDMLKTHLAEHSVASIKKSIYTFLENTKEEYNDSLEKIVIAHWFLLLKTIAFRSCTKNIKSFLNKILDDATFDIQKNKMICKEEIISIPQIALEFA